MNFLCGIVLSMGVCHLSSAKAVTSSYEQKESKFSASLRRREVRKSDLKSHPNLGLLSNFY